MRIDNRREKITPPHFEDAGGVKREFRLTGSRDDDSGGKKKPIGGLAGRHTNAALGLGLEGGAAKGSVTGCPAHKGHQPLGL
jgi:hypothetical protein